jgi:hypothetical protein
VEALLDAEEFDIIKRLASFMPHRAPWCRAGEAMEQVKQHTSHIYRAGHWFRLLCYVEKHRQKIYNWLASPDHDSEHRNARDIRQETTGSWFVKGEHFQEW